jgi:hypothetical protein
LPLQLIQIFRVINFFLHTKVPSSLVIQHISSISYHIILILKAHTTIIEVIPFACEGVFTVGCIVSES